MPATDQQHQQQQQEADTDSGVPVRAQFLTHIIDTTLHALIWERRAPTTLQLQQQAAGNLRTLVNFETQWLDNFVALFSRDTAPHAAARAPLQALAARLREANAAWNERSSSSDNGDSFYAEFHEACRRIFKVFCEAHDEATKALLLVVQGDLATVRPLLVPPPDVGEDALDQSSLQLVVDAYRPMTIALAQLIESIGTLRFDASTPASFAFELEGFEQALDIENVTMADLINDMSLNFSDQQAVLAFYAEYAKHITDVKAFAEDLARTVRERLAQLDKEHSYRVYEETVQDAVTYFASLKENMESELNAIGDSGVMAKLKQAIAKKQRARVPSVDVAQQTDMLDAGLEKLYFAVALEENIPDLLQVAQDLLPVLASLPAKLVRISADDRNDLDAAFKAAAATIDKSLADLRTAKAELQQPKPATDAVQRALATPNAVVSIMNAIAPDSCDALFNNDANLNAREALQDSLDALQAALQAARKSSNYAPVCATLAQVESVAAAHREALAAAYQREIAVLDGLRTRTEQFAKATSAKLVSAVNDLVAAQSLEGNRDVDLFEACRAISIIVDIASQLTTVADDASVTVFDEASMPSPGFLKQSDVLDTVRALYNFTNADLASKDAEPQVLVQKQRRVGTGSLQMQMQTDPLEAAGKSAATASPSAAAGGKATGGPEPKARPDVQKRLSTSSAGSDDAAPVRSSAAAAAADEIRHMRLVSSKAAAFMQPPPAEPVLIRRRPQSVVAPPAAVAVEPVKPAAPPPTKAAAKPIWAETGKLATQRVPSGEVVVKSGTLNQLLIYLTLPESAEHSPSFQPVFLATLQMFLESDQFLQKLIERYDVPACPPGTDKRTYELGFKYPIQLRVCDIIKAWLASRAYQDIPPHAAVRDTLNKFIDDVVAAQSKSVATNLRRCYDMCRRTERFRANERWATIAAGTPIYSTFLQNKAADKAPAFHTILEQFDCRKVARALTTVDSAVFRAILAEEFSKQRYLKPASLLTAEAPRVAEMMAQTNRLAIFVAHAILMQPTVRGRRKVLSKMILLTEQLVRLRNYHSAFAVVAGLQCSAIKRLKHTWRALSPRSLKLFETLEKLVSSENDFAAYRQAIAAVDIDPVVPFLGALLKDVYTVDAAHRDALLAADTSGLIDWQACEDAARKALASFMRWQETCYYAHASDPAMCVSVLRAIDTHLKTPAELFALSTAVEPPNAIPVEKTGGMAVLLSIVDQIADFFAK